MSDLDDAIAQLERAIARLEAVYDPGRRAAEGAHAMAVATGVAERLDVALAKLEQLLEQEA